MGPEVWAPSRLGGVDPVCGPWIGPFALVLYPEPLDSKRNGRPVIGDNGIAVTEVWFARTWRSRTRYVSFSIPAHSVIW